MLIRLSSQFLCQGKEPDWVTTLKIVIIMYIIYLNVSIIYKPSLRTLITRYASQDRIHAFLER